MEYTLTELKKKIVINIKDGKKIGKISDITFNDCNYTIKNFIVSPSKINLFCHEETIISPSEIDKIGEDAILVNPGRRAVCDCQKILGFEE